MSKKRKDFYEFGPFRLDPARRILSRGDEVVSLTPKVLHALLVLVENRGRVVAKDELMKALWPDTFVEEGNLTQNISTLRKALGEGPAEHRYIATIPKQGYRFVAAVTEPPEESRFDRRKWVLAAVMGLAAILAIAAGFRSFRGERPSEGGRARAPESLSATPLTSYPGLELHPSFSPDGNQVVFDWNGEKQDNVDIYVKVVGSDRAQHLTVDPASDYRPAWSPDGRSVAFLRALAGGNAAVLVIPAGGGPEKTVAVVNPGYFGGYHQSPCLEWSPDGKWILTLDKTSSDDPSSLFLIAVATGEKKRLTFPKARVLGDRVGTFSADGRTLAFSRSQAATLGEFCVLGLTADMTPAGEPSCFPISDPRVANFGSLRWTPDQREVMFSSLTRGLGQPGLFRMAVPERPGGVGTPQRVAISSDSARDPAFSPDGRRLAYSGPVADVDIWRLPLRNGALPAAAPAKLISSTQYDWAPQYSPNGENILFLSSRSGRPAIWVVAKDGTKERQVTTLEAPLTGSPRWSPDGRRIVFDSTLAGQFELYVVNADGGELLRLTNHPANDGAPSWSRDGQWIYFTSHRSGEPQIWKIRPDGREPTPLTRQGGQGASFDSANGKFVYYAKNVSGRTSLWRVPATGGDEVQVLDSVWPLHFTVVHSGIYFIGPADYGSSMRFLSFATNKVTTIAPVGSKIQPGVSVSPDGRFLLYSTGEITGSDLMLVENFR